MIRVDGQLPYLLPLTTDADGVLFYARDIPLELVLEEHHDGLQAAPRRVTYALHSIFHFHHAHFTAHGFVASGAVAPYVFFHDAMRRPFVRPAERSETGLLSCMKPVARVWYVRGTVVVAAQ